MAGVPQRVDVRERFTVTPIDPPPKSYRVTDLLLQAAMVLFIFPLMYTLIGMAKVADYISRRRLRKRTNAAIQEQAKRRPRRAF